jgi:hypothetical protein
LAVALVVAAVVALLISLASRVIVLVCLAGRLAGLPWGTDARARWLTDRP